jgi:hypothetical protein
MFLAISSFDIMQEHSAKGCTMGGKISSYFPPRSGIPGSVFIRQRIAMGFSLVSLGSCIFKREGLCDLILSEKTSVGIW